MDTRHHTWFRLVSRTTCLAALLWLATACGGWLRPFHPTPLDALTEFPGYLSRADLGSVQVLQEREVAGGVVMLYRHTDRGGRLGGEGRLSVTFVTPAGGGWRAQSSGSCGVSAADDWVACCAVGENVTDLTSAYGWGRRGSAVHVEWSDGQTDEVSLDESGTFLVSRPQTVPVRRIELLDENGEAIESRAWQQ